MAVIACVPFGGEALDVVREEVKSFPTPLDPQNLVLGDNRSGVVLRILPERDPRQRPRVGKGVPVLREIKASSLPPQQLPESMKLSTGPRELELSGLPAAQNLQHHTPSDLPIPSITNVDPPASLPAYGPTYDTTTDLKR